VALQITIANQAGTNTLRNATSASQTRTVPTDPNDPTFIKDLDIRIEDAVGATLATKSIDLTATQQQEVRTEVEITLGQNRRITIKVNAFNSLGDEIFRGETTVDLPRTDPVPITLTPVITLEAVTPSQLANKFFMFADGAAFGVSGPVTLTFGPFLGNTGTFTLVNHTSISGIVTIETSAATTSQNRTSQLRQASTSTCRYTYNDGQNQILHDPCGITENGSYEGVNAETGQRSTSSPPTTRTVTLNVTVKDVLTKQLLADTTVSLNGTSQTTDANGAATFTNVPIGSKNITASRSGYLTHAFTRPLHLDMTGLILFLYPLEEETVDTDEDGLPNAVESNTRIYLSPLNTGTDPNNPDTDGDGLKDGAEILVQEVRLE
jgi:hypothetical protein